jgi:hypothetical protein
MEDLMKNKNYFGFIVIILVIAFMLVATSCFGNTGFTGGASSGTPTPIKPEPVVSSLVATTSGTQSAYYATLDVKVKNNGAEGTILVTASVTQGNVTNQNQMPVYLKQGEEHEVKMTFPLTWGGGEFKPNATASIP